MKYTQLNLEQRYKIEALLQAGKNQSGIVAMIGVHLSMVSEKLIPQCGQAWAVSWGVAWRPTQGPRPATMASTRGSSSPSSSSSRPRIG